VRPLVTSEEMKAADEATISGGTPAEVLMDRAGRAVARAVIREAGARYGTRVTVVCGKGNNGGDGYVVARVLAAEGLRVVCCLISDEEPSGAAKHHLDLLRGSDVRVVPFHERYLHCDVIVDAVLGTGFSGEPRGPAAVALGAILHAVHGEEVVRAEADAAYAVPAMWPTPRIVSVDVSSAGRVPADLVVAIAAEKRETFFGKYETRSRVIVADVGIAVDEYRAGLVEDHDVLWELPRLSPDDHKTSHGHVAVLTGSTEVTGAPLLTARGAARMGAGYVSLGSTRAVIEAASVKVPEVLKSVVTEEDSLGPSALDRFGSVLERADVLALGPGLGTGEAQRELIAAALKRPLPLVLDADALNVLAGSPDVWKGRDHPTVLTPHAAEMARLLEVETSEVLKDRLTAALEAAERFGCIVVLKGRNTVVARGEAGPSFGSVIPVGGPELATAGTGDVLTGAIAALLARNPRHTAVSAACYVHGIAGEVAAGAHGETGVVAWDVAEALPEAVRRIRAPYASKTCL